MLLQDVDTKSSDRAGAHLRIVIVGAGLSGLTAAIQSALGGHSVLVLESAKELGEVSRKIRVSALTFHECHRYICKVSSCWSNKERPTDWSRPSSHTKRLKTSPAMGPV